VYVGRKMTKKEKQKLIKAIDYFLDDDPDKWTEGIDELFLLAYGVKWTHHLGLFNPTKTINVGELLRSL